MAYALFCADLELRESLRTMDKVIIFNAIQKQKSVEVEIQKFLGKKLSSLDFFEIVDMVKDNIKTYKV
jgi:hypothetical protein